MRPTERPTATETIADQERVAGAVNDARELVATERSIPNQWSADGPGQQLPPSRERSCSRGSYGAINGAKIAMPTKSPTRTKPTIAPGLRRSRDQASPRGRSAGSRPTEGLDLGDAHEPLLRLVSRGGVWGTGRFPTRRLKKGARGETWSPHGSEPKASDAHESRIRGLRNAVGDVDEQVDEDEDERDEEDPALQHRVVASLDRLDEPGADPGPGEDGLGQHRAGEQQPRLKADDRRDRQHRVAENVPRVDGARRRRPSPAPCGRSPRSGRRARLPA